MCLYDLVKFQAHILYNYKGVEKLNDDMKKIFFRSSNKWDPATDMLANEYKLATLNKHERRKRKYK